MATKKNQKMSKFQIQEMSYKATASISCATAPNCFSKKDKVSNFEMKGLTLQTMEMLWLYHSMLNYV